MRPPVTAAQLFSAFEDDDTEKDKTMWLELDDVDASVEGVRSLPANIAQAIRDTAAHLDHLDPYALIGVEQDAGWAEIEHAYRQRLAMFHPGRWSGYDLADLRPPMENITSRISYAFAALADEAAQDESIEGTLDRATQPADLETLDTELSGDRPTFPTSVVQALPGRARPPRPPPRKTA